MKENIFDLDLKATEVSNSFSQRNNNMTLTFHFNCASTKPPAPSTKEANCSLNPPCPMA